MKMTRKTKIIITVDVESSIGGYFNNRNNCHVPAERHIHCKINGKDQGIGLIMDILDKNELKGVFFVETEARHYFGDDEMKEVVEFILKRGHDVQLHIHPGFRSFRNGNFIKKESDSLCDYSAVVHYQRR